MDDTLTLELDNVQPDADWGILIGIEKPTLSPVYRIPGRDERTGPKPTLNKGDRITYSRCVSRVGYESGVHSLTKAEWWNAGLEIVAKEAGVSIEDAKELHQEGSSRECLERSNSALASLR